MGTLLTVAVIVVAYLAWRKRTTILARIKEHVLNWIRE